jgi:hypothetical protein
VAKTKAIPVADPLYGIALVRANGKHICTNRVWVMRPPAEPKGEWDQFTLLTTIPQDTTSQTLGAPDCGYVTI